MARPSPLSLSTMPSSSTPRGSSGALTQFFAVGGSLRPNLRGSAPPVPPSALASRLRRPGWGSFRGSIGSLSHTAWWPPGRTDLGLLPAAEAFTPELSPGESPPPDVRYNCGADWVTAPAGLSPAGTTASWAARGFTTGLLWRLARAGLSPAGRQPLLGGTHRCQKMFRREHTEAPIRVRAQLSPFAPISTSSRGRCGQHSPDLSELYASCRNRGGLDSRHREQLLYRSSSPA